MLIKYETVHFQHFWGLIDWKSIFIIFIHLFVLINYYEFYKSCIYLYQYIFWSGLKYMYSNHYNNINDSKDKTRIPQNKINYAQWHYSSWHKRHKRLLGCATSEVRLMNHCACCSECVKTFHLNPYYFLLFPIFSVFVLLLLSLLLLLLFGRQIYCIPCKQCWPWSDDAFSIWTVCSVL